MLISNTRQSLAQLPIFRSPLESSSSTNSSPDRKRNLRPESLIWLNQFSVSINMETYDIKLETSSHIVQTKILEWTNITDQKTIDKIISTIKPFITSIVFTETWLTQPNPQSSSLFRILCSIPKTCEQMFAMTKDFFSMTEFECETSKLRNLCSEFIRELSFLPTANQSQSFNDCIFDSIKQSNESLKPMLIQSIFQLIEDESAVSKWLIDYIPEDPSLVSNILTALQDAGLQEDSKNIARRLVIDDLLPSSKTTDLPSIIQFLTKTTDEKNCDSTVEAIRNHIPELTENEDFSTEDSETFLLEILRNESKFNLPLAQSFIKSLERSEELHVIDVWLIFCLYSVYQHRLKVQQIIQKHSTKLLTEKLIIYSIINHSKSLENLTNSITDLNQWLLSSKKPQIFIIGKCLSKVMFKEFTNISVLQDVVASILSSLWLSENTNRLNSALLLKDLSKEFPEKMKNFTSLIDSIIWSSNESLEPLYFTILIKTIVSLEFRTSSDIYNESQLRIVIKKLLSSHNSDHRYIGCVANGLVLKRILQLSTDENDDPEGCIEEAKKLFQEVTKQVYDYDAKSYTVFLDILTKHCLRYSQQFNEYIFSKLRPIVESMINDSNGHEMFGISENEPHVMKMIDFVTPLHSKEVKKMNNWSICCNSGSLIALFLFVCKEINKLDEFEYLLELPVNVLIQFFGDETDDPDKEIQKNDRNEMITSLMLCHSWFTELVNCFCETCPSQSYQRLNHLTVIEENIAILLRQTTYVHPLYGEIFANHKRILKKCTQTNVSCDMFDVFREPKISILQLISQYTDETKTCIKLFGSAIYINSQRSKNCNLKSINITDIEQITELVQPQLVSFASKHMNSENEDLVSLCSLFLTQQLQLIQSIEHQRQNIFFDMLISSMKRGKTKSDVFISLYNEAKSNRENIQLQLNLLKIMNSLLKTQQFKSDLPDNGRDEHTLVHKICENILKSTDSLKRTECRQILTIYLNNSGQPLKDVVSFINCINEKKALKSMTEETMPIYIKISFNVVNNKLRETKKKIDVESQKESQTEEASLALFNRINKLITVALCIIKCADLNSWKPIFEESSKFCDSISSLIPFIKETTSFDIEGKKLFLSNINNYISSMFSILDHKEKNDNSALQLIPNTHRSLITLQYTLKRSINK